MGKIRWSISGMLPLLAALAVVAAAASRADAKEMADVLVGEEVVLECRFNPSLLSRKAAFYWIRENRADKDNVAIDDRPLEDYYRVDFNPSQGKYDLHIRGAAYERDNGRFECKMKEIGTGNDLYSKSFQLTVLLRPGEPTITPAAPVATEGKPVQLTCSSTGGSPDPQIYWYKGDSNDIQENAVLRPGGGKDNPTESTLTVTPTKDDDGVQYRCSVWNRALGQTERLQAFVRLDVNYYPRVKIGPRNPTRVEAGTDAELWCEAEAKPPVVGVRWARKRNDGRETLLSHQPRLSLDSVTIDDAGTYVCRADNGLGRGGETSAELDVLHGPIVTVGRARVEGEEGGEVTAECRVRSNPAPNSVEWVKLGDPSFRQNGRRLSLNQVTSAHGGTYVCRASVAMDIDGRATPIIREGNASVEVVIQHAPGKASIRMSAPFAVADESVTLTCVADPPGWPTPVYEWWKVSSNVDDLENSAVEDEINSRGPPTASDVLSVRENLTLDAVTALSEGLYRCRPHNRVGAGTTASFALRVAHPPAIARELHPTAVGYVDRPGFSVNCSATGKPEPTVAWFKDGQEIYPGHEDMFRIVTESSPIPAHGSPTSTLVKVTSHLIFQGERRPGNNLLIPEDRGRYSCRFTNPVGEKESTMRLRMQHEPIAVKPKWKFAAPEGGTAIMFCRAWAYPLPTFRWTRIRGDGAETTVRPDGRRIATNVTEIAGDLYQAVLRIDAVTAADFGEYICSARNNAYDSDGSGDSPAAGVQQSVTLVRPGKPETPMAPVAVEAGADWILVSWDSVFDGGVEDVEYVVRARPATSLVSSEASSRTLFHCKFANPCNLTSLQHRTTYLVQVKAVNPLGESEFSDASRLATGLTAADLPNPEEVTFGTVRRTLSFTFNPRRTGGDPIIAAAPSFSALVEIKPVNAAWKTLQRRVPLSPGAAAVVDVGIDDLDGSSSLSTDNKSQGEELEAVRVRICAADVCGTPVEANIVDVLPGHLLTARAFPTTYMIVIVVCGVAFLAVIFLIACCCCRKSNNKGLGKGFDVDSPHVRPNLIAQQPPPPPYYTANAEPGKTTITIDEPTKSTMANGYTTTHQSYDHQQSYSNSNNGGSVNSQDSLWRPPSSDDRVGVMGNGTATMMVNGAANGGYGYITATTAGPGSVAGNNHHLTNGGFTGSDDYAHYPPMMPGDYGLDPYGVTAQAGMHQQHHQQQHHQQHQHILRAENPYGNMSLGSVGLPELSQTGSDQYSRSHQPSLLGFNESMDSEGPATRGRRVIHEVIV